MSFIAKEGETFVDKFQLVISLNAPVERSFDRVKVTLTALRANGEIHGKQIWCSPTAIRAALVSEKPTGVVLDVDPILVGAAGYKIAIINTNGFSNPIEEGGDGTTCTACASLANDTCGRGRVAGVTCGANGACAFTCKP